MFFFFLSFFWLERSACGWIKQKCWMSRSQYSELYQRCKQTAQSSAYGGRFILSFSSCGSITALAAWRPGPSATADGVGVSFGAGASRVLSLAFANSPTAAATGEYWMRLSHFSRAACLTDWLTDAVWLYYVRGNILQWSRVSDHCTSFSMCYIIQLDIDGNS